MKLFAAKVNLTDGDTLHPLTVIAVDKKHATTMFIHYLSSLGIDYKNFVVEKQLSSALSYYNYDPADPVTHVVEHPLIEWQAQS
uniref:hypothetical protein n=1 Tax=Brucella pseudintermedia TaxID=370111 RepID=UPI00158DA256|nr:hypothetical protein [Brucella pseudintermedia]